MHCPIRHSLSLSDIISLAIYLSEMKMLKKPDFVNV